MSLPKQYQAHYQLHADEIEERLAEFASVPAGEYLWELCYCILTPQSRAVNAAQVIGKLRGRGFLEKIFDPTPHLRNPEHYIRFHNQKSKRLMMIARSNRQIMSALTDAATSSAEKRAWLAGNVPGLGWKEASHFLRNIGHFDLAIIDRHVLKHLLRCNVIDAVPVTITPRMYLDLEQRFTALAASFGLTLQQLDLLFWSLEEGSVRK